MSLVQAAWIILISVTVSTAITVYLIKAAAAVLVEQDIKVANLAKDMSLETFKTMLEVYRNGRN